MLRLKEIRWKSGKTQQDIADFLNISRAAYTNIENGKRDPDTQTLLALADYFDVTVDYLMGGQAIPVTPSSVSSLSESDIAALAERVRNYSVQHEDTLKLADAKEKEKALPGDEELNMRIKDLFADLSPAELSQVQSFVAGLKAARKV